MLVKQRKYKHSFYVLKHCILQSGKYKYILHRTHGIASKRLPSGWERIAFWSMRSSGAFYHLPPNVTEQDVVEPEDREVTGLEVP